MRKSRFSESQIVGFLKELDAGVSTTELARRIGVHPNTIRDWRSRYDGMSVSDVVNDRQARALTRRGVLPATHSRSFREKDEANQRRRLFCVGNNGVLTVRPFGRRLGVRVKISQRFKSNLT